MPSAEFFARLRIVGVLVCVGALLAPAVRAAEYFVNAASANCSNTGPGTEATPYCTITAALAAHHAAGTIITVLPGTYREQITVSWSGTSVAPITLRAQAGGPPVIVDATDDYSSPALWTHFFGDVWVASGVTWAPRQVFADDARLTPSTADPLVLPARSFRYMAGFGLYVNAGGGSPATHATQVGKRLYGFYVSGRTAIRIEGFTVQRAEERCVQITNSSNVEVVGNRLKSSGRFGLQAQGDSAVRIASNVLWDHQGHGISFTAFTAASIVEDNESYGNADPAVRTANGLYMFSAPRNLIRRNRWHHNQDTGHLMSSGSNDNVSVGNRSWSNGDHGFDHVGATGSTHVNDVAYGNFNDGFSFEGGSIDSEIRNVISIENGATTLRFNLFVDTTSTTNFDSDDNIFWNSGPRAPVRFAQSVYSSVAWYSEMRDQDDRTLQVDPLFVAPATGDFHLQAHSPAIDNANTDLPEWSGTDAEGLPVNNDPGMPDLGVGPVAHADRGALEFQGSSALPNQPPSVQLTLSRTSGVAPLLVRADASGSTDPEAAPLSYMFDLGDGTVLGPQSWPFADHIFGEGTHVVQVTITDAGGASVGTSLTLQVAPPTANHVTDPSFESGFVGWAPTVGGSLVHATGGHTGSHAVRMNAPYEPGSYGLTDDPRWIDDVPFAGSVYHLRVWVKTAVGGGSIVFRVRETHGNVSGPWTTSPHVTLSSVWAELAFDYTSLFKGSKLAVEIVNQSWDPGSAFFVDDVSIECEPGERGGRDDPWPERGGTEAPAFAAAVRPNPMSGGGTWFRITTTRPGAVAVDVFDLAGRRVRELPSTAGTGPGSHAIHFDGRGADGSRLAAGVYHYRVRSAHGLHTGRLVRVGL